jgi:hypothetical protein
MSDKKIKAATQEILEVLRKYDLSAYFVLVGRHLVETRWRFAAWSCFEQLPHPGGSEIRFRTRKSKTGERRPEQDIADSCNIARAFAEELAKAAIPSIQTWEALSKKLGAEGTFDEFRGPPPKWDFE